MKKMMAAVGLLLIALSATAWSEQVHNKATPLFSHDLEGIPDTEGMILVVDVPPGGADPVHRHDASVFVYMLEGEVEMKLKGKKAVTLTPGDTFFEGPEDVHEIGRNVSKTEPAKFVVFFVKDKNKPAVLPVN